MRRVSENARVVVERFFDHLTARDWGALAPLLAADIERIGPFGDGVVGRDRYLDLLACVVPEDYRNVLHRVVCAADGRSAFARVTEHLVYPGRPRSLQLEEVYAFVIDEHSRISRVEVYWQTPQFDPGGFGSGGSDESYASGPTGEDRDEIR
jgi:hypothetical protein